MTTIRESRFPGRRLSPVRLSILLLLIAAIAYGGLAGARSLEDDRAAEGYVPWFGAYVDATASPMYPFESPQGPAGTNVVLSFLVASDARTCEASWGGYHTLGEAQTGIELDRRLARLEQFGGNVVLSFGGEAGTDLALACDTARLVAQYEAAITRYEPAAIDLDIEGDALRDVGSRKRRAEAVAELQDQLAEQVPVWLTLPVGREGLTPNGVEVVREFLDAGVTLAGVNAMTMNFATVEEESELASVITSALQATHRQVGAIYADAGIHLGQHTLWRRIGATPMIGQNDVAEEVFTLDQARAVRDFARNVGLGRMSMWSANRDRTCADAYADLHVVSDACSGIDQGQESFADVLGAGFPGTPAGSEHSEEDVETIHTEELVDDPATSPYPIWDSQASYPKGTRVVWRRNVYVANWWSTGMQPDDPTRGESSSPWRLVGPVLKGETPIPVLQLPADFYPAWEPAHQYDGGERVMFQGGAYEAKWWTVGDTPAAGGTDPGSSPWRALTQEEIEELLDGAD